MSNETIDKKEIIESDISELFNPFPGLRPFGVEETYLFFGREGQSDDALVKLSKSRFLAILGASGSGKSSFMYCGLIPSLQGGMMTKEEADKFEKEEYFEWSNKVRDYDDLAKEVGVEIKPLEYYEKLYAIRRDIIKKYNISTFHLLESLKNTIYTNETNCETSLLTFLLLVG